MGRPHPLAILLAVLLALNAFACSRRDAPRPSADVPPASPGEHEPSRCLELANRAADWLAAAAVRDEDGVSWKPYEQWAGGAELSLYSGTPGVVLFFLEHHALTGEARSRELIEAALARLMASAKQVDGGLTWEARGEGSADAGLYTGTAGVGAVFLAAWQRLGEERYREHARGAADWLCATAKERDFGVAWNDSADIISGAAGTGLFLLRAAEVLEEERWLETAALVGDQLIADAIHDEPGWKWGIGKGVTRIYPNFSHGTSGIAYYLAALHRATGEQRYLDAAFEGAKWLAARSDETREGSAWFHHEPDGEELYYAGWCHGPGGTARLFRELFTATGEAKWLEREAECAAWLMGCGLGEKPLDGFWNVSACCGSAGIGDFFVDLHRHTGGAAYREWAERMVADLEHRASPGEPGSKWIQAEHRVRPELLHAQTGLAQGAAGIGLFLLKMHAVEAEDGSVGPLALPDSPY